MIWNEIIQAEKIPMECHFEHIFHNPVNRKYDFINSTVRGSTSKLSNLIGLIQHSFAFIGVASGPFITSLSVMPARTFYLEKHHKLENYTRLVLPKVDVMNYRNGVVKEWLTNLM